MKQTSIGNSLILISLVIAYAQFLKLTFKFWVPRLDDALLKTRLSIVHNCEPVLRTLVPYKPLRRV